MGRLLLHRDSAQLAKIRGTAGVGRWAGVVNSRGTRRVLDRDARLTREGVLGKVGEGLCGVLLLVRVIDALDE